MFRLWPTNTMILLKKMMSRSSSMFSLGNEGMPVSSHRCTSNFAEGHSAWCIRHDLDVILSLLREVEHLKIKSPGTSWHFKFCECCNWGGQVRVSGTLLLWPRGKSARCQGQCRCCRWQRASVVLPGMPLRTAIALRVSIRPSPTMVCIAGFQEFTLQCCVLSVQIRLPNLFF